MRQLQCPGCGSYALLRTRRSTLTKIRFPNSRQYRCSECGSLLVVNQKGETLHTRVRAIH